MFPIQVRCEVVMNIYIYIYVYEDVEVWFCEFLILDDMERGKISTIAGN
jgi:hypothetical protein